MMEFPPKAFNRVRWLLYAKTLKKIGVNSHVGSGFSVIGAVYISIGDHFIAGKNLQLHAFDGYKGNMFDSKPELVIGNHVTITDRCYISCAKQIEIGDGVLFGPNVFVGDNFHGSISMEEIEKSGFDKYYVDHTLALWPQAAGGIPFNACEFQSKGDPITDLMEDMAADGAIL